MLPRPAPLPGATRELLASLQQGAISAAAYDTAFVARLRQPDDPNALAYRELSPWLSRDALSRRSAPAPLSGSA